MQDKKYNHIEIEKKWQEAWEKNNTFSPDMEKANKPFYNLMMFPYPSAEGLHVGNMYAFTGADVYGRFNRMQGNDVFEPIGLDGFGIHSENYALKVGRHPQEQAKVSQANFYRQLRSIGNSFDWNRTVETYDPDYYRWTQWLFIQLFKAGLAYRKKAEVNFCPSCKTVLSDEQVIDGKCERCGSVVEKKELEQWFFKITNYADRLLENIKRLDWPEKVLVAQRNWIGKSEGAVITFKVADSTEEIEVFTTRPDTLFGATFMVVAPEHPIAAGLQNSKFKIENSKLREIDKYIQTARNKSKDDRTDDKKEKTGVDSGIHVINPVTGEKIPVWIADYVLMGYGTGAIMAVPAHDTRDFEFAKKYKLPIVEVISGGPVVAPPPSDVPPSLTLSPGARRGSPPASHPLNQAHTGEGKIINSQDWDGWETPSSISKVIEWLEAKKLGRKESNYHLRDWLISRQRYWGPPIPLVFCQNCADVGKSWLTTDVTASESEAVSKIASSDTPRNDQVWDAAGWYPVEDKDLPVLLPDVEDWKPMGTGLSPLANHPEFYEVKCPECGEAARRETDVSDTFLDSAWYFLRYPSVGYQKSKIKDQKLEIRNLKLEIPWDPKITRTWLPVTKYIGGAEHSVLHLLYARFIWMVLRDLGCLDSSAQGGPASGWDEPFPSFFAHGLIIKDGAKMSKSKGNVVVPDEYIEKYGADTLRTYLMFLGPYSDGGDFRDNGIEGMSRFIRRVWTMLTTKVTDVSMSDEGIRMMHKTIKKVTEDVSTFHYNTAISTLMEWYNFLSTHAGVDKKEAEVFLKLLAPFAPYLVEELWEEMGNEDSIHLSAWPTFEEKYLVTDEVVVVVQVNGKRRGEIKVQSEKSKEQSEIEKQAREIVKNQLEGKALKRVIHVPGKIVNFVI